MNPCSEAYRQSLQKAGVTWIRQQCQDNRTRWFSSVYAGEFVVNLDDSGQRYWVDNMLQPVLFTEALTSAVLSLRHVGIIVEVGPHPALQKPAKETLKALDVSFDAYVGTMRRDIDDTEAISNALGTVWTKTPTNTVDIARYARAIAGVGTLQHPSDLPSYQWDHTRKFWSESRRSRVFRTRKEPVHTLCGAPTNDRTKSEHRWRNRLSLREMPWLAGHRIQGQVVFPAAAFVATVMEAMEQLANGRSIQLIEVQDTTIGTAIILSDDGESVEVLLSISESLNEGCSITATWSYLSASAESSSELTMHASGKVMMVLGDSEVDLLPPRESHNHFNLHDLAQERFYSVLDEIGYNYSGDFQGLHSLRRRLGFGTGSIRRAHKHQMLVDPAILDAGIQSIILAFCWPGDGRLKSVYVPSNIKTVRLDYDLWLRSKNGTTDVQFDANVVAQDASSITGDVLLFSAADDVHSILQVEGLTAKPLVARTAVDDFQHFSEMSWDVDAPRDDSLISNLSASSEDYDTAYDLERMAYYYLRLLKQSFEGPSRQQLLTHHQRLLEYADLVHGEVEVGKHQYIEKEWSSDDHEMILDLVKKYPDSVDAKIMHAIGENIITVVRDRGTILEHMRQDGMLDIYYRDALGKTKCNRQFGRIIEQIVHRYPHLDIVEIGAGTGSASKAVFDAIGHTYKSYHFTDISSGFFESAADAFSDHSHKMTFKTLDIEKDPCSQGFQEQSFDLIIASNVLHATKRLDDTLWHVRKLLRPGGYLVVLEITNNSPARLGFVFGGLPGWWLGREDGRVFSPCITLQDWSIHLVRTGFSGVEYSTPAADVLPFPESVMVSRAVDEHVKTLIHPLSSHNTNNTDELCIVASHGSDCLELITELTSLLGPHFLNIYHIPSLDDVSQAERYRGSKTIVLADVYEPICSSMSTSKLRALKVLFENCALVLWVSRNARNDKPEAAMSIGLLRSLALEFPQLRYQHLDLHHKHPHDSRLISESMLRLDILVQKKRHCSGQSALWSLEPEVAVDDGKYVLPRLKLNRDRNARYNSGSRPIHKFCDASTDVFSVSVAGKTRVLREASSSELVPQNQICETTLVKVLFSSLWPLRLPGESTSLFIVLGHRPQAQPVVTLTSALHSSLQLPTQSLVDISGTVSSARLCSILWYVVARSLLYALLPRDTLVILDSPQLLWQHASRLASAKGVCLVFVSSCKHKQPPNNVMVHPNATSRAIKNILPANVSAFATFSKARSLSGRIRALLAEAIFFDGAQFFTTQPRIPSHLCSGFSSETMQDAVAATQNLTSLEEDFSDAVLSLDNISSATDEIAYHSVLDWEIPSSNLAVQLQPVDAKPLFSSEKTYWLIGLTGGLGLSLTEWMIDKGACHIVISSRRPKVDNRWLQACEKRGANVHVWAADVTDIEANRKLITHISLNLPPIGGVAQGAMVLHDCLFAEIDLSKVEKVLRPKVQGSLLLEELLAGTQLDFMIYLSSMASVTGEYPLSKLLSC